jgi:hypothetical protein
MNKRFIITAGISLATLGTLGGTALMATPSKTAAVDSPIVQTVNTQSTKLANHEARIKNAESNIRDLQIKTGTPISQQAVVVPADDSGTIAPVSSSSAVVPDAAPVETAPAVTVTAYKEIVLDADNSDCEYTYSDGSKSVFRWKTTNPQGSWQTDGQGNNGHWVKSVSYHNFCDDKALGLVKQ